MLKCANIYTHTNIDTHTHTHTQIKEHADTTQTDTHTHTHTHADTTQTDRVLENPGSAGLHHLSSLIGQPKRRPGGSERTHLYP